MQIEEQHVRLGSFSLPFSLIIFVVIMYSLNTTFARVVGGQIFKRDPTLIV